jgi:hypothetical protein
VVLDIAALYDVVKKTVLIGEARWQPSMLSPETSLLLQNKMLGQGWCPTNVQKLSSNLDPLEWIRGAIIREAGLRKNCTRMPVSKEIIIAARETAA